MALNLPQVPFKLTPQDMGAFDLGGSIRSGLQTYGQGVAAKYANQQQKADLFHKIVSPLANIAISPYAALLGPGARQQMAGLIGQAIANQSAGSGAGGMQGGGTQSAGMGNPFASGGQGESTGNQGIDDTFAGRLNDKLAGEQVSPGVVTGGRGNEVLTATPEIRSQAAISSVGGKRTSDNIQSLLKSIKNLNSRTGFISQLQKGAVGMEGSGWKLGQQLLPPDYVQAQQAVKNDLMKYHQFSKEDADAAVQKAITETNDEYLKRISKLDPKLKGYSKNLREATRKGIELNRKNKESTKPPVGAATPMYKNGILHFIPSDKAQDAAENWGYTYEK